MFLALAIALTVILLAYIFFVRDKDLPETPVPVPYQHLEGRKAAIYENLRDLNFEYRVGKLSDADYERTKKELQAELGRVLAEIDSMKAAPPGPTAKAVTDGIAATDVSKECPHCGAKFEKALRFCGECGKPMGVSS